MIKTLKLIWLLLFISVIIALNPLLPVAKMLLNMFQASKAATNTNRQMDHPLPKLHLLFYYAHYIQSEEFIDIVDWCCLL